MPRPRWPDASRSATPTRVPSAAKCCGHLARENGIRRLEQVGAQQSVAAFGDAPGAVDIAGLVTAWRQAEVGANRTGSPEPFRVVDDGDIGQRDDHADRRNAHQPLCCRISLGAFEKLPIKDMDLLT